MVVEDIEEVGIGKVAFVFIKRGDELSTVEILDQAFVVVIGNEHPGGFVYFGEFKL